MELPAEGRQLQCGGAKLLCPCGLPGIILVFQLIVIFLYFRGKALVSGAEVFLVAGSVGK